MWTQMVSHFKQKYYVKCSCSSEISKLGDDSPSGRCVVRVGWLWIDSASFSLYVFSASVLLQALTVISVGGIADHPPHRKILLLTCAWAANVGFGTSVVAMNAYLPSLARESPEVLKVYANLRNAEESALVLENEAEPDDNNEAVAQPLVRNTTTDEL
ncbi:autophagy-type protein 22 [Lentinula edodes]|uniref:Autophagy-related protein n=1 Tax=Lentinula edodes TaxID=5353 RepID=A0A1Q3EK28_LENED|nr:autophagy-type protein 22 [Lentinula edodes]